MGEADGSAETSTTDYVTNPTSTVKVPTKGKAPKVYSAKTYTNSKTVDAKDIKDDFIKSS